MQYPEDAGNPILPYLHIGDRITVTSPDSSGEYMITGWTEDGCLTLGAPEPDAPRPS